MRLRTFFVALFIYCSAQADFQSETRPYSITGKGIDGLQVIKDLSASSGLAKLGIKKNDIVLDTDNNPIQNLESAKEAYRNNSSKIATVLRNDELLILVKK